MKRLLGLTIIIIASLAFLTNAQSTFPKPAGYVNDFAGVLTNTALLENELAAYEENTTIEIALVTVKELPPDQTLATYAVELFAEWGIGKSGEDNGILILIVPNGTRGNRLRIELGYGIQGYITGAEAGRMLDNALPFYETGDYQRTAESILIGLSEELVNYVPGQEPDRTIEIIDNVFTFFPFIIFALLIMLPFAFGTKCPKCKSRKLECKYDENSNMYVCTCKKCGHTFKKKRSSFIFVPIVAGGFGGSSGGFGGFGGGGSGGGGAGR